MRERGVPPSQHVDKFTNMEALQTSLFRVFYGSFIMQAQLIKSLVIGDLTYYQSTSLSQRLGSETTSPKLPIKACSFWQPALILKLSRSLSIATSSEQKTLYCPYHSGNSKGCKSSGLGTRDKDQVSSYIPLACWQLFNN